MYVVTGDEMRQIDAYAMNEVGLSDVMLMENAGNAVFSRLKDILSFNSRIMVVVGSGNNGGDGFVIGRRLLEAGFNVDMWVVAPEEKLRGAAKKHARIFSLCGYDLSFYEKNTQLFYEKLASSTHIVDCLLGTGVTGELRAPYDEVVQGVNDSPCAVISVDIPSGVPADEGVEADLYIQAERTLILQSPKETTFLYPYAEAYGKWEVLDIGIPSCSFKETMIKRFVWSEEQVSHTLPKRKKNAHKGMNGKGLVIGGSKKMPGALSLTTQAALRTGIGLLTVALPEDIRLLVTQTATEATLVNMPSQDGEIPWSGLEGLDLTPYDSVAIGPGMGRSHRYDLYERFQNFDGAVVMDADALYHLSKEIDHWKGGRKGLTVISPHPGEMALLTNTPIQEVEANRFQIARTFAKDYQMIVVLKGAYTITTAPDGRQWVNLSGNPALAKGGSGDVLTGMILASLHQHQDPIEGVLNAVYVHGHAADQLIQKADEMSVTATDVIHQLQTAFLSLRYP
ncbi:bifunctional ADP-dependent NAD(P)H-hydrate dehydratase/NAD(P)H-hydrate epimerase [Alteribacter aurantiacus]|uniref:bifunctional ADP-dependent NAD(P)H-hydrate dehydratase/NAD(P)H-hydrate epimerase n=1 Tax=Alteribacter aurantiacus TaxID=254410 RepID=UPI0003FBA6A2|nr:bifunctional ADP-dependent NAD(P)H-hydrate dehydratase/NAD(P)H-hydrate epimerase [Alteribacter aurantiacus]